MTHLHDASKTLDTIKGFGGLLILADWFTMYADDGFGNYIIVDFSQAFYSIN